MKDKMADAPKSRTVTLTNEIWDNIGKLAEAEKRSVNNQLAVLLEKHLPQEMADADVT